MEKEKPGKEKFTVRLKRNVTSLLKKRKRYSTQNARNRESAITDTQPPKENSEGDELMLSVVLDGTDKQHHDTISPEEKDSEKDKVGETAAGDEKLLKDLPSEGYQKLVEHLQPLSATGRDYRSLADKMGYSNQYIQWLGSTDNPVMNLLRKFRENDRKISAMTSLLKEMERNDVLEDLQPYVDATPTKCQREKRQQRLEEIEELQTIHDSYDAFLCFANTAKKDSEFVEKLRQKMESPPYNLRLCFSERDFLGGGCYLQTAAVAIEKRCRKFVAVLSSNFDDSEGAIYESHIAMSLSPGAQERRFIPILIEDAYRFKIPLTIQHLTYLDYIREEESNFWYRLACSLGWRRN